MPTPEEIEARLREDTPFYAQSVLKIVGERGHAVPFVLRPAQLKVEAALAAQRAADQPQRVIVLKSRRTGVSTFGMAKLIHRCTTTPNRNAAIVAHNMETAGALFDIGEFFYGSIPNPPEAPDWLKPELQAHRNTEGAKVMHWGEDVRRERQRGNIGVNSRLTINTASSIAAGRGLTITDLWGSEVAYYPDPKKILALANAVFDVPETLIAWESTANGHNFFKGMWDAAERGESAFTPVFISWLEDPNCRLPMTDEERENFEIGAGPFGEDEPALVELGATLEQLKWRRRAIVDKANGKLEDFKQEYPSFPAEAFVASGRHVFSMNFVQRVLKNTEVTDPQAEVGVLVETGTKTRRLLNGEIEVPTGASFVPKEATGFAATHDFWRVWEHPWRGLRAERDALALLDVEARENAEERLAARESVSAYEHPGQYIVSADVADGEENTNGEKAWHAAQIIDHLTGEQVAVYRSREDPDEFTRKLLLAALFYNQAWIVVETTGSHGLPVARGLALSYGYPKVYRRPSHGNLHEKQQDRLGWDTNRRTKPLILSTMTALLREGTDGIRDRQTALEFQTYVELPRGGQGPDDDAYADLLMAWGIAQQVRTEIPARRTFEAPRPTGTRVVPRRPF